MKKPQIFPLSYQSDPVSTHTWTPHSTPRYDPNASAAVSVRDGQFTWDKASATPTLTGVNLEVKEGELVAVVGQVGAGKSSLVSAILGEMEKVKGQVTVKVRS